MVPDEILLFFLQYLPALISLQRLAVGSSVKQTHLLEAGSDSETGRSQNVLGLEDRSWSRTQPNESSGASFVRKIRSIPFWMAMASLAEKSKRGPSMNNLVARRARVAERYLMRKARRCDCISVATLRDSC